MSNERPQTVALALLGIIALVILGLVFKIKSRHVPPSDIPAPDPDARQVSDSITVDVYLDGSGSIQHFLQARPAAESNVLENYLAQFLDKVGTTLANPPGEGGWKNHPLNFFTFGDKITKLPDNDFRQLSLHPEQFNARRTLIETAVNDHSALKDGDEATPELKIIITDLYQNGGRLDLPANALAAKYLADDNSAVGVLAVRNPFDGQVEDFPGTAPNEVLTGAADSMPFYVIVAGPTGDVRHAIQVLLSGTGLETAFGKHQAQQFFFSRTPAPRRRDPMTPQGGSFEGLSDSYNNTGIPLLSLSSGTVSMSWPNSLNVAGRGVNLFGDEQLNPTVKALTAKGWQDQPQVAAAALAPCSAGQLLCEKVDRSGFPPESATYILRFDRVSAAPARVLEPDSPAVEPWNIEEYQAEAISHAPKGKLRVFPDERPFTKAGKTPDLSKFLKALQGQMFHQPVTMTSYYVYLQAK